jgi:hypothetical protein
MSGQIRAKKDAPSQMLGALNQSTFSTFSVNNCNYSSESHEGAE